MCIVYCILYIVYRVGDREGEGALYYTMGCWGFMLVEMYFVLLEERGGSLGNKVLKRNVQCVFASNGIESEVLRAVLAGTRYDNPGVALLGTEYIEM